MKFRPCIDIHNGKVKQIVGSSLLEKDGKSLATDNFVSGQDAEFYARLYKDYGLLGGHVIILNSPDDIAYKDTLKEAQAALLAYPGGLQIGGGVNDKNAKDFIDMGASQVIVTSFVFHEGRIDMERLQSLVSAVGPEHIVLDLSAKAVGDDYRVATNRWQTISEESVTPALLEKLSPYCHEFLIHASDVEGKKSGIDEDLLNILARWEGNTITYAGGIKDMEDIDKINTIGRGRIDFTVGSALDLFGGTLSFKEIARL